ncbi:DUF2975 domain-containing protein [Streptomyces sp. ODS28]|uniref:DUF2975 domain-containing protein n=1 Tax=Streptomyces sp. ODS28 TaxID=3136688 RepID=UPI0031E6D0E0
MHRHITGALRAGTVAAFLLCLFGQIVVIPGTVAGEVDSFPPYAPYAVPYAALAILGVACVQVGLVAVWMLLAMVRRDALFTPSAFRWVDVLIAASVVATLLALGAGGHLATASLPSPGGGMDVESALGAALACAAVGAAFAMLLVVMRGLLRKATALETEMAAVV